ncbi:hypothetical protein HB790_08965 [Listeria welshimeri]|uniref:Uncharacterized protein n=1 Tax=Listeria welshimeri serovar 6b (strain ATCC 35897 / DSM 20650 / CCUG 15529 / CIP 8149 / NCTC 11857 / SLCC 5334 / V8) TaxID=386043 RepID=A0AFY9_LISW6|nr:hypothetical protein [Listeria welshimeri]MBC1368357.1 hypothetical protein [Listeria welshimeri]MBC1404720.1 hypothetical protein [Listeria welshimeri]MBC1446693.1 hypothetical protein [Listeria welshimeri]MBC1452267.1 hypothetical protein [Listeria welshimeri]MBC1519361.1 hypothetical protein [Listeria welshimeri]
MSEVRLFLDYKCYPVWVYDEAGFLEENDLPDELKKDKDLDEKLTHLQDKYNNLFTDTEIEFRYNGFNDENEKEKFLREFTEIQKELEKKLKNKYKVVSKILV